MVRPDVVGFPLTPDDAQHPVLGECLASCSYGEIDGMADAAGRQADIASQIISFAVAEPGRHSFGFAGQQPVEGAARCHMQRIPDIKEPVVRLVYSDVRPVSQPAGCQGTEQ